MNGYGVNGKTVSPLISNSFSATQVKENIFDCGY
jgi:hypothetical protein